MNILLRSLRFHVSTVLNVDIEHCQYIQCEYVVYAIQILLWYLYIPEHLCIHQNVTYNISISKQLSNKWIRPIQQTIPQHVNNVT